MSKFAVNYACQWRRSNLEVETQSLQATPHQSMYGFDRQFAWRIDPLLVHRLKINLFTLDAD
ncbi:hypothetical protein T02_6816 [Trichinella nativa]|uniref:Uncharacterized protein n=3 Tax=Trichinella TaxID=6333 RepID=A0A0V1L6X6_9BILA|nr:hypothetical protein T05_10651 [Trichinella murrelli]KRX63512.1 hypothetical protein T09_4484 [Trichinella sp. T9]KRX83525.1 hypothetical protein T06_2533 [Trichinella sp. T6]KRY19201.1 hypothetical protein T12_8725 [Trichinella patagoniensis]KRZ55299.1 hypothetical protein T02_6816 [Trichinella nativa]KRZ92677.1 hypothetical protein T08_14490 [Trichinella sp. T8]